jgi:CPA1 family monovalent cation:H+ antiporter
MALLLRTADVIIDSTRADGRLGYLRAARRRLRPSVLLRGAQLLNYWVRVDRPLTLLMGQRFTMLLVMRLVFLAQLRFLQQRMTPVLGVRVTEVLGDIVQRRRSLLDDAMDAMGKLYPGHAETLQAAMLTQIGLRFETNAYAALRDEALLSDELFEEIQRDIEARRDATGWPVLPDLPGALARRLAALPRFDRLPADLLEKITRQVNMRFVLPGERILRRRERDGAVYVISSGEVEIEHANRTVRLAGGEMFGGDGMLGAAQTQGAVTATRYCHLLVLRSRFFRTLSAGWPVLISADRMVGVPM